MSVTTQEVIDALRQAIRYAGSPLHTEARQWQTIVDDFDAELRAPLERRLRVLTERIGDWMRFARAEQERGYPHPDLSRYYIERAREDNHTILRLRRELRRMDGAR